MPTTYAIPDGRTVMAATTYTGNGTSLAINNSVNGVSFQPDFVWLKSRTNAYPHIVGDSVRGASNRLIPNTTDSEANEPTNIASINSNGFSVGSNLVSNASGASQVAWQWKAGGSSSSNTNGSITSTVSAGATQGFSVVTYTASSSASTIGHGLGVAPSMIIQKNRDAVSDWGVYHISVGATKFLKLNSTDAPATNSIPWNDTTPTSTVFSIGTGYTNGNKYVAYCFSAVAGYSAIGSYTGNSSTDGTFVYTGFRPRFVLIKGIGSGGSGWQMNDSSRNTYNPEDAVLRADLSNAETTAYGNVMDFLSNGFKLRVTDTNYNSSSTTYGPYIYAAFAENPFKYANAR